MRPACGERGVLGEEGRPQMAEGGLIDRGWSLSNGVVCDPHARGNEERAVLRGGWGWREGSKLE
jgi:hypothetical protein